MIAPTTAAAEKSIANSNKPLPRNTVEKNWSSRSPSLSRSTPIKKGNSGERHEMHRERDIQQAIFKPRSRLERISGHRKANKPECHEQQRRKQDARHGGGSRRPELRVCESLLARIHRRTLFARMTVRE